MLQTFEYDEKALEQKIPKYAELMRYAKKCYSDSIPNVSRTENFKQIEIHHITSKLMAELTPDFYGYMKEKSLEYKKIKTIEIYRFFYRFSIEKLQ